MTTDEISIMVDKRVLPVVSPIKPQIVSNISNDRHKYPLSARPSTDTMTRNRSRINSLKPSTAPKSQQMPLFNMDSFTDLTLGAIDIKQDLDGWGDFDTDRLLQQGALHVENTLETPSTDETPPGESASGSIRRISSRGARTSVRTPLATARPLSRQSSQRNAVLYDFSSMVAQDPTMCPFDSQMLVARPQQFSPARTMKINDANDKSTLPVLSTRTTCTPANSISDQGLFGPHIPDNDESREVLFGCFNRLWFAMSSSSRGSILEERSPFECTMILVKLCTTVGIAVTSSPNVDWSNGSTIDPLSTSQQEQRKQVNFHTFVEFVIRHVIKPAMSHYQLEHNLVEYVQAIIDSVLAPVISEIDPKTRVEDELKDVEHWRVRELHEINAVLPQWKVGFVTLPNLSPSVNVPEKRLPTLDSSVPGRIDFISNNGSVLKGHKLSGAQARAQQQSNIQRKLQLRQSWQPRVLVVANNSDTKRDMVQLSDGVSGTTLSLPLAPPSPLRIPTNDVSMNAGAVCSSSLLVEPDSCPSNNVSSDSPPHITESSKKIGKELPVLDVNQDEAVQDNKVETQALDNQVELVCGVCVVQDASLWCSSCFAVYCPSCWTTIHHSMVDTTAISHHKDLMASLTTHHIHTGNNQNEISKAPPCVAMVYLPTKAIPHGKLAKTQRVGQQNSHASGNDVIKTLLPSVSSHSILPKLRNIRSNVISKQKSKETVSGPVSRTTTPSTANLVKGLMLGSMTSMSALSSVNASPWTTSLSSSDSTTRIYKDPVHRTKVKTAAITLNAEKLLPTV